MIKILEKDLFVVVRIHFIGDFLPTVTSVDKYWNLEKAIERLSEVLKYVSETVTYDIISYKVKTHE